MRVYLIFFCAWLAAADRVLAWGNLGHQIVAQIAYNHLDPEVKAKCDNLLTNAVPCGTFNSNFVASSTWADGRCEAYTSTNHYIDIPISLDGSPTNGVANEVKNVVAAIRQEIATLQDPTATLSDQSTALRYLIHFVGDIQQPLHCSAAVWASNLDGDAGGNQFSLGNGNNLHSFWDGGGGYLSSGTASSKAVDVETNSPPYSFSIGSIPDPYDWAWEGRELARTNTYVGVTNGLPASASYSNRTQATTMQRMAIGGQRLAKLLNTIFVTNGPTAIATTAAGGNFGFTWSSVSGRVYRVQSKQQITDPAWTDLTDVTASTSSAVFSEAPDPTVTQRFYRVVIVN